MARQPIPHPTLATPRLRLRQFRAEDADAMHACYADPTAMLAFCFGELRLHRVQALIHPDNTASRALATKFGFQLEGRLHDNLRVGDEWRDDLLYALLANNRPGAA